MKRNISGLISALLCAAMLLSLGAVPTAAEDAENERYGRAYSLLSRLGILDGLEDPEGTDSEDGAQRIVSRAEFTVCLSQMLDIGAASSKTLYYNDVPSTHFAFDEITLMTDTGYMNGTGYKKFDPDEPMAKRHAMTAMLKALGLSGYIDGGAADDKFIDRMIDDSEIAVGVSSNEYVTFSDMVVMTYNALLADYYELTVETAGQQKYKSRDGDSLLYETREMRYEKKKLLSAANGADIYGIETDVNAVVIDGISYDGGGADLSALLGRRVDYVWLDDGTDSVVWAAENGYGKDIKIIVDENTEYDPDTGRLRYTVNGKERRVNISTEASIVYNGKYTGNGLEEYALKRHNVITVLASSGQDYDIVLVESYRNIMVSGTESRDNDIYAYDRDGGERVSLNSDDYELLRLLDTDGGEISWSDINKNDILSVFESEDNKIAKIIRSNSTFSGKVETMDSDGYVTVDGNIYETYDESVTRKIASSSVITCYLDYNGYIAAVETGSVLSDQFVGFILSGAYSDGEIENGIILKILAEDGTVKSYYTAPKLNIDGTSFKNNQIAYEAMSLNGTVNGKPTQQIALIKLNEKGEIRRLDFASPDDGGNHPLTINRTIKQDLASVNQAMYTSGQGRIGVNMLVDANTKVFMVPQNLGNDYSRCIVTVPRAWDDYRGAVSYRTTQKDNFVEQYIVTRQLTYATIGNTHPIRMVEKVYEAVNSEDEVVWMLTCTDGNSVTEYEATDYLELDKYNLHKGDVLRVATTATNNNKLEHVSIVTRAGDNAAIGAASRELPYDKGRVVSGYANDRLDYYLKIGWDSGNDFDEILKLTAATPIAVYDSVRNEVYKGTIDDIKTQTANGEASRVLVQTNEGTLQRVFVYR